MKNDKTQKPGLRTGILWTKRLQWPQLKYHSIDGDEFLDTYDKYNKAVEQKIEEMEKEGFDVVKVEYDMDELLSWCDEKSMLLDGKARSQFATEKLMEMYQ